MKLMMPAKTRSWAIWLALAGGSLVAMAVITQTSGRPRVLGSPGKASVLFTAQGTSIGQYEAPPNPMMYGAYITAWNPSGQCIWFHGDRGKPTHSVESQIDGEWHKRWSSIDNRQGAGSDTWVALRPDERITWRIPIDEHATAVKVGVLTGQQRTNNASTEWRWSEVFRLVKRQGMLFMDVEPLSDGEKSH